MEGKLGYLGRVLFKIFMFFFVLLIALLVYPAGNNDVQYNDNDDWEIVNAVIVSSDIVTVEEGQCLYTVVEYKKGDIEVFADLRISGDCNSRWILEDIQKEYSVGDEVNVKLVPGDIQMTVTEDYRGDDGYMMVVFSMIITFLSVFILFIPVKEPWASSE